MLVFPCNCIYTVEVYQLFLKVRFFCLNVQIQCPIPLTDSVASLCGIWHSKTGVMSPFSSHANTVGILFILHLWHWVTWLNSGLYFLQLILTLITFTSLNRLSSFAKKERKWITFPQLRERITLYSSSCSLFLLPGEAVEAERLWNTCQCKLNNLHY